MLTIEPLPRASAPAKPRARRSGAKKLSWKTLCQPAMSPLRQPSRSLVGALGETPALLTSACSGPPSSSVLASAMKASSAAASPRSAVIWCVQFGSRWHSGGTGSREVVMMRQPASLNRRTVAWPMPRLAPVRMRFLRSAIMPARLRQHIGARLVFRIRRAERPRPLLMRQQHRQPAFADDLHRGAAEDHLAPGRMAVAAHDEKIGALV